MKVWAQNTTLAIASLLVVVLGAEILVRMFLPQVTYSGGQSYRDEQFFDLKKNFTGVVGHPDYEHIVSTNSNRLRKTWRSSASREGTRVLVLGDSFIFGMGVEDDQTIPSYLATNLNKFGIAARVWNGGVPAYSLSEIL
jgi:hypothetical protein